MLSPSTGLPSEEGGTYTYGYSDVVVDVHGQRTATREAAFFLPHLKPGMRVLDVGCGPGSITVGLAGAVAPGEVVGVDVEGSVLERARGLAHERGVANVRFEAGSVYDLPFSAGSFDAVFAHTLLEHVPDPPAALHEMHRVLRPGGIIGVRDCDWASGIWAPADPLVEEAVRLYARVWEQNGGHPTCGRQLRGWLHDASWTRMESSASFRWDGSQGDTRSFGELLANRFQLPNFREPILAMGWSDSETLTRIGVACLEWSRRPDAFAAMIMCEALGWAA